MYIIINIYRESITKKNSNVCIIQKEKSSLMFLIVLWIKLGIL
jgi:hypothetical protein